MEPNNLHVHIESHQDHSFWHGSFVEFSMTNSLTPGQLYSICQELELVGQVHIRSCDSTYYTLRNYTLRSETQPHHQKTPGLRGTVQHYLRHYLRRGVSPPGPGCSVKRE